MGGISVRAATLKADFISTVEYGSQTTEKAQEKLDQALKDSKSVEQIRELADVIVQITEQTNLLALNAAIADDSKNTVVKIPISGC